MALLSFMEGKGVRQPLLQDLHGVWNGDPCKLGRTTDVIEMVKSRPTIWKLTRFFSSFWWWWWWCNSSDVVEVLAYPRFFDYCST
ncbi:hypothetical protein MPTK1_8g13130 [Marchantia polymorpha subsp. ruderalis]